MAPPAAVVSPRMVKVGSGSGVRKKKSSGSKVHTGGTNKKARLAKKSIVKATVLKSDSSAKAAAATGPVARKLRRKAEWKGRKKERDKKEKDSKTKAAPEKREMEMVDAPTAPSPPVLQESTGTPEELRGKLRDKLKGMQKKRKAGFMKNVTDSAGLIKRV